MLLGGTAIFICNMTFVTFADPLTSIFTVDPKVIYYCKWRIHVALAFQWIATSYEIPAACMRGFGQSLLPAVLTIIGTCFLRLDIESRQRDLKAISRRCFNVRERQYAGEDPGRITDIWCRKECVIKFRGLQDVRRIDTFAIDDTIN